MCMQDPRYQRPEMDSEPDPYRIEGGSETVGDGTFAKLRFTSLAHLAFSQDPRQGIAQIVYYVQAAEDGTYVIRRSDHLYPYPKFEASEGDPVLFEKVRAFKIVYYDKEGQEKDEWNSESDDNEYSTPQSMGIQLTLGSEEFNFEFGTDITLPVHRFISMKK